MSRCTVSWPIPTLLRRSAVGVRSCRRAGAGRGGVHRRRGGGFGGLDDACRRRVCDADHLSSGGETCGPRLHVEGEFRTLGAKFDRVFGKKFDLAVHPLAIEKSAVAAAGVRELEGDIVAFAHDADERMFAADDAVADRIESDLRRGIAADSEFARVADGQLFDLIGFRARQMSYDDTLDWSRHYCPLRQKRARLRPFEKNANCPNFEDRPDVPRVARPLGHGCGRRARAFPLQRRSAA